MAAEPGERLDQRPHRHPELGPRAEAVPVVDQAGRRWRNTAAGSAAARADEVTSVCRATPAANDSSASSATATASSRYRAASGSPRSARHSPRTYARQSPSGHGPGPLDESRERGLVPRGLVVAPGIGRLRRQIHQDHRQDVGVVGGGDGGLVGALPLEAGGVEVAAEAEDGRQRLLAVAGRRRISRLGGDRQCPPSLALREVEVPPLPQVWAW